MFKAVATDDGYEYLTMLLRDVLNNDEIKLTNVSSFELVAMNKNEKRKILDIIAKTNNKKIIDIELNSVFDDLIRKRNLEYYYSLILNKDPFDNTRKKSVIQINLCLKRMGTDFIEEIKIYNVTENDVYTNNFRILNVNVARYKKLCYDKIDERNKQHIYLVALLANKEELKRLGKIDKLMKKVEDKVTMINEEELEYMKKAYKRATDNMIEDVRYDARMKEKFQNVSGLIKNGASKELVLNSIGISEKQYNRLFERINRKKAIKK